MEIIIAGNMRNFLIFLAIIGAVNVGLYAWQPKSSVADGAGDTAGGNKSASSSGVNVVYFGATWCPPCRQAKPKFIELSSELSSKASFRVVDVDQEKEFSQKYAIRSIPMIVVLKEGNEVARFNGGPKDHMRREIEAHLSK